MSEPVHFVLIDDHPSMRTGIRTILEDSGEFVSVGEGECVKKLSGTIREKRPDIALVDINLSTGSGFDIFSSPYRTGDKEFPRVLMLSMFVKSSYVVKAITLGAAGYVTKNSPPHLILDAARAVASGHHYFDIYAADVLVEWIRSIPNAGGMVQNDSYNALSEREKEIFILLARGMGSGEIASQLHISRKTASNYRNSIMRALGLESSIEIQAFADEMGLL